MMDSKIIIGGVLLIMFAGKAKGSTKKSVIGTGKGAGTGVTYSNVPDIPKPNDTTSDPVNISLIHGLASQFNQRVNEWVLSSSDRCDTFGRMAALSDNNLVALANFYKNTYGATIREELKEVWLSCGNDLFGLLEQDPFDWLSQRIDELLIP